MDTEKPKILVVDDQPRNLDTLEAMLGDCDCTLIRATSADEALLTMVRHEFAALVLDIRMPELTGLGVLEALEADGLSTRVILLTGSASDEQIVTAVERGAWGILLKESAAGTLLTCLETVASGQRWLPEELVAPAVKREAERRKNGVRLEGLLTRREYEVAGLVAQGLSNKHICRKLNLSEGTVKLHLHSVYQKLEIPNRTSLVVLMQNAQSLRDT